MTDSLSVRRREPCLFEPLRLRLLSFIAAVRQQGPSMIFQLRSFGICAFLCIFLFGCGTRADPVNTGEQAIPVYDNGPPFTAHSNVGVRYPARFGAVVGAIIGIPVTIACLPVTVPMAAVKDENMLPVVPLLLCTHGGGTIFGAIFWPLFGWW
jgi:hypothetical protein